MGRKFNTNRRNLSWSDSAEIKSQVKAASAFAIQGGHFEITMNLPRSDVFIHMTQEQQMNLYCRIFDRMKLVLDCGSRTEYTFECCKSGHIHMHALIIPRDDFKFFFAGAIADIVKKFCIYYTSELLKYTTNITRLKYEEKCMHYDYHSYSSPAITVNYHGKNATERLEYWHKYMRKDESEDAHVEYEKYARLYNEKNKI